MGFHHVDLSVSQLFRKDLISAMKLPDNEPLEAEDYWTVTDTWKQEWERGVQVKTSYNLYKHVLETRLVSKINSIENRNRGAV